MSLQEYKRKRHFESTPEPKGKVGKHKGNAFVIQKHAARNLHYDFRLELDGVLKSWAVPKGPCLDPTVKRLAMQVEDHPLDYGSFEGTIPKGEYGGGTVMLWDRGTWEPIGDPHDSFATGKLKFKLNGKKLHGRWMLVRTHGMGRADQDQRHWLLFKERDEEAQPLAKGDVLTQDTSVKTGRSMDEIANHKDARSVWHSKPAKNGKQGARRIGASATSNGKAGKNDLAGVRLTHPEKVLYPEDGITKLDLAAYYYAIADWILPHIEDRPLVLVRCPEGHTGECFFQKHPGLGSPAALRQIPVQEKDRAEKYVVVDDKKGLISLVQISALEIHAWGSRADKLERPDRLVFDLDPAENVAWPVVVQSAREVRDFLKELDLRSFVKTSGGKGLHLVVPIDRRHDWDEAKTFCKMVADAIVQASPRRYTANMAKAARPGKIFIDYLRNGRGATAVVAYSTRARPGAPVSAPLAWEELNEHIHSTHFTIRNMPRRLASLKRDPWHDIACVRQSLAGPLRTLGGLVKP